MLNDPGSPISVIMLDLDGFKEVNDRLGHAAGDDMLQRAAALWRAQLRAGDELARVGGDEFVILLPGTSASDATQLMHRLTGLEDVACSAGVSERRDDDDIADLVARGRRDVSPQSRDTKHGRSAAGPHWLLMTTRSAHQHRVRHRVGSAATPSQLVRAVLASAVPITRFNPSAAPKPYP